MYLWNWRIKVIEMTKIIINMPYSDDEFNYAQLIQGLDEYLHQMLDSAGWQYEIYRMG